MAPKPFKPPRSSDMVSVSSLSPSIATKKKPPDRSKNNTDILAIKKAVNSGSNVTSRVSSGPSTASSKNGRKTDSSIQTNKRRKFNKSDRRTSSASTIKLPSLSPSTSEADTEANISKGEEEQDDTDPGQEKGFIENLEIDDLSDDDNDDDIDDPFGSFSKTSRLPRSNDQIQRLENEDEDLIAAIGNDDSDEGSFTDISKIQSVFIPHDLLSVLLHEMFKSGSSSATIATNENDSNKEKEKEETEKKKQGSHQIRMTKQAVGAVGKYLDTFVREAVARAAWEGIERGGTGVLEVEDLERLAPQLILDF